MSLCLLACVWCGLPALRDSLPCTEACPEGRELRELPSMPPECFGPMRALHLLNWTPSKASIYNGWAGAHFGECVPIAMGSAFGVLLGL